MAQRANRFFRSALLVWVTLAASSVRPEGSAPEGTGFVEPLASTPSSFSFAVRTPPPALEVAPDGWARIALQGFDESPGQLGAPELPVETVLVAIPEGAEPRLEVRRSGASTSYAVKPRPLARENRYLPGGADVPEEQELEGLSPEARASFESVTLPRWTPAFDAEVYGAEAFFPEEIAWLGEIGRLRDQRFVAVHLAPVRWNGSTQALDMTESFEVTVHFDGAEVVRSAAPPVDPSFEGVYRRAFVNPSQSRDLRARLTAAAPVAAGAMRGGASGEIHFKIRVRETGFIRLDHAFLLAHAPELLAVPTDRWSLRSQGVQVGLHIHQVSGGGFDDLLLDRPEEYVEFYGQALDEEPTTSFIGTDGTSDELHAIEDYTDENAYFLSTSESVQPAIPVRSAAPGGWPAAGPHFVDTVHAEVDDRFLPWRDYDVWYWNPILSEAPGITNRTDAIELPGLASGTAPLSVRVSVRGASDCLRWCSNPMDGSTCIDVFEEHATGVSLFNAEGEPLELSGDDPNNAAGVNHGAFPGREGFVHSFTWTHSIAAVEVTSPLQVRTEAFELPGPCSEPTNEIRNDVLVNWIAVDYARAFEAIDDRLTLTWPHGEPVRFDVTGFTTPDISVFEIGGFDGNSWVRKVTRLVDVEIAPDAGQFRASFSLSEDAILPEGTPRRFALIASGAVSAPAPADFERDRVSTLGTDTTQADLVVIVHSDLVESVCSESGQSCAVDADCVASASDRCEIDPASRLAQLLALRASQGITSRVARMPDIEDEFNHGLNGPEAIESFLAFVLNGGWQAPAPAYVLLLGDATYDAKGGTAAGWFVPTQLVTVTEPVLGFYASDNLMADVVGPDRIPDAVLGRLPARTIAEADAMLDKLLAYDAAPAGGSWRSNAVLVSDRGRTLAAFNEAAAFESMNDLAVATMVPPYTHQKLRYWTDNCQPGHPVLPTCEPLVMEESIKAAVNGTLTEEHDGAALMQFTGHGSFALWSNDVFFCTDEQLGFCAGHDDTEDLTNAPRLPWLMVHNCLSGAFHQISKSFGEQWLKAAGGGAIAVYAPTGLGYQYLGQAVIPDLWAPLFGPAKERRIAVPILDHLVERCSASHPNEGCHFYALLGDPSLHLGLPEVDPAKDLTAAPANDVVELSWQGSETPGARYDVYRRLTVIPGYQRIATGIEQTSFTDTAVLNAVQYRYYVVAVDGDGFESAWSNFNSDCEVDGPDCVQAVPLNPKAPSKPTGVVVTDVESGGCLRVNWTPNPEDDVDFYTLHHGPTPTLGQTMVLGPVGPLDQVPPTPEALLFGLPDGEPYYVAVTATNTSGLTSAPSDLAEGMPHLVLGVKAPDTIGDLRLARSGADIVLTWGEVTRDIYGKPLVAGSYEVFRSTDLHFKPDESSRIATVLTPTHTDPGRLEEGGPDEYYLVRALDLEGNPGGAGRQLPDGIRTLELDVVGPGQLGLSWPAVSEDFDHQPTVITHYELWTSEQPVSRQAIEDGSATLVNGSILGTSITVPLEPDEPRYYSVLAVDVRGNRSPF